MVTEEEITLELIDYNKKRDEFMSAVYELCSDDATNDRANNIIDVFDSLVEDFTMERLASCLCDLADVSN